MAIVVNSSLQVVLNGAVICTVPKSLKYQDNMGKNEVTSCSVGGTSTTTIHSRDNTDSKSTVTFAVRATDNNLKLINSLYTNIGKNVIELSSADGGVAKVFEGMSMIEYPEIEIGAGAELELKFEGDSIV